MKNWKDDLSKIEKLFGSHQKNDWQPTIHFVKKLIPQMKSNVEVSIRIIYLFHNILVEEEHTSREHDENGFPVNIYLKRSNTPMKNINPVVYMESSRKPTKEEEKVLDLLIVKSSIAISENWKDNLLVCPMDDGEMGSLYLFPNGQIDNDRTMGKQISELQFKDQDNVDVIATLNVDNNGDLFELDIWKTGFGKLIKFPNIDRPVY